MFPKLISQNKMVQQNAGETVFPVLQPLALASHASEYKTPCFKVVNHLYFNINSTDWIMHIAYFLKSFHAR